MSGSASGTCTLQQGRQEQRKPRQQISIAVLRDLSSTAFLARAVSIISTAVPSDTSCVLPRQLVPGNGELISVGFPASSWVRSAVTVHRSRAALNHNVAL